MEKIKVTVVKAEQKHIDFLKDKLRESDIVECWAMAHMEAGRGLQFSFDSSDICYTALLNDEPVLVFGASSLSVLGIKARPWMLGSDRVKEIKMSVLKRSKKYIKEMLEKFEVLENYVDVRNTVSVNWIRWCGYKLEKPEPFGPDGVMFRRFWLRKDKV